MIALYQFLFSLTITIILITIYCYLPVYLDILHEQRKVVKRTSSPIQLFPPSPNSGSLGTCIGLNSNSCFSSTLSLLFHVYYSKNFSRVDAIAARL